MKTSLLIAFLLLPPCGFGGALPYRSEYAQAVIAAARAGDGGLVEHLIESGADPNTMAPDRHSLLFYACTKCYGTPKAIAARIKHVKFLISKGANVNLTDSFGIVALLAAERSGNGELISFLKQNGATPINWSEPSVKAGVVLIDGEILQELLALLCSYDGSKYGRIDIPYDMLKELTTNTTLKVAETKGRDLFGRPYVLSTKDGVSVTVDPATVKDLRQTVARKFDYWKGLGPDTH